MEFLTLKDWELINNIVKNVGESLTLSDFCNNFLWLIRPLVPFDNGHFIFFDREKKLVPRSYRINIDYKIHEVYMNYYINLDDFMKNFLNTRNPKRSSDFMNYSKWVETEFFNDFMKKNHFYYQATTDIHYKDMLISSISLVRSKKSGDFSMKEIIFLKLLSPHIANHMYKLMILKKNKRVKTEEIIQYINQNEEKLGFSNREREIVDLVIKGKSNLEISDLLFISPETVKRHLSTIYTKSDVQSRTELLARLLKIN